jgi:hypothetical protein
MSFLTKRAHHVLQIRAMMASEEWESKGQDAVLLALGAAADSNLFVTLPKATARQDA